MSETEITARAKAFTGSPVQTHRFVVYQDGTVAVFDSVARHFTICHALSKSAERRIVKLAGEKRRNARA